MQASIRILETHPGQNFRFARFHLRRVGFTGLAAALLAGDSAIGLLVASLFFATLSQGGLSINSRVPMEIVDVLVAAIILLVAVAPRIEARISGGRGAGG